MQLIERPDDVPNILQSKAAIDGRERMRTFFARAATQRAQSPAPPPGLRSDDSELVEALSDMSNGRCAFCEARDDLIAHRFRPPGNALPLVEKRSTAHLYYLWLSDAWQNLYPICRGCVPKEPQFPVTGARANLPQRRQLDNYVDYGDGVWPSFPPKESALLLDPTADGAYEKHMVPRLDGELIGESRRGELTTLIYDLNRPDRRNQRYQSYHDRIERLLGLVSTEAVKDQRDWDQLFNFSEIEFGGSWYLMLRRIARWVAGAVSLRWRASRSHIRAFFVRLASLENAQVLISDAIAAITREDQGLRAGRWGLGAIYSLRTPIAEVELTNFKAIEKLHLKFAPPRSADPDAPGPTAPSLVILGENATGKSSILEGIALALASGPARSALDLPWSDLVLDATQMGGERRGSPKRAEVRVKLVNDQSVTLAIENGSPMVRSEFGNQQVPVFAYGAFRRYAGPTRQAAPGKHIRNLFDASTLSNPEPWLRSLPADQFNLVIRTLHDLLSIEGEFDVIQRVGGQLRMVTSITDPDGQVRFNQTPLRSVSSGYRSMLAMVCDIMRGLLDPQVYEQFDGFETAQGIVLIDEIEAHLHPRWKVQVMTSLRSALPGMTFIVTTHDPLCLRGMGEGEVCVLQRIAASDSDQASNMPILVEQMSDLPDVANLRIEQLLTSDFFQLLSSDDASSDRRLAHVAELIRKKESNSLSDQDAVVLRKFENDIASALPVGSSEVHQLVQGAVAEYLKNRRDASSKTLVKLRAEAKAEILRALETL
ncbi:AAA family ATPase [Blastomonas fulva]|uniref:AAA family ATPase n=1 Tax=Blastomonas fulva TaxID=1550728 RepID=UPI003F6E71B1